MGWPGARALPRKALTPPALAEGHRAGASFRSDSRRLFFSRAVAAQRLSGPGLPPLHLKEPDVNPPRASHLAVCGVLPGIRRVGYDGRIDGEDESTRHG